MVYFAGWKNHWALYPVVEEVRSSLGPEFDRYPVSKGTLRFPWAEPLRTKLVERIVRELARAAVARGARRGRTG